MVAEVRNTVSDTGSVKCQLTVVFWLVSGADEFVRLPDKTGPRSEPMGPSGAIPGDKSTALVNGGRSLVGTTRLRVGQAMLNGK
jgi:hypothetical protein